MITLASPDSNRSSVLPDPSANNGAARTVLSERCALLGGIVVVLPGCSGRFFLEHEGQVDRPICQIHVAKFGASDWLWVRWIDSAHWLVWSRSLGCIGPTPALGGEFRYPGKQRRFIMLTMQGLRRRRYGAWLQHRFAADGIAQDLPHRVLSSLSALDIVSIVANSLYGALVNDVVSAIWLTFLWLFRCVGLTAGIIFKAG